MGEPGGNGGTVVITSWKCNFSIYSDIQAIKKKLFCFFLPLKMVDGPLKEGTHITHIQNKSGLYHENCALGKHLVLTMTV